MTTATTATTDATLDARVNTLSDADILGLVTGDPAAWDLHFRRTGPLRVRMAREIQALRAENAKLRAELKALADAVEVEDVAWASEGGISEDLWVAVKRATDALEGTDGTEVKG